MRGGIITMPEKFGVEDVRWRGGFDFIELERMPESAKWWLSCLGCLRRLIIDSRVSAEDAAICREIIEDFVGRNPTAEPAFPRAWDGHAAALRTGVLLDVAAGSEEAAYLDPILRNHLDFLADEDNFQGQWNHGVDQAIALIQVARRLSDREALRLGLTRIKAALDVIVDDEGVTIEQAIHYQLYNFRQISRSVALLKSIGDESADELIAILGQRQRRMRRFLAHATKPDGAYYEIGDTPLQEASSLPGAEAEFAATQGVSGTKPRTECAIYEGGYIFGRTGWGEDRPYEDESSYAMRFGPPRKIHGHFDHGSILYHALRRDILREGGFHGYTVDETRTRLRSPETHNGVTFAAEDAKLLARPSMLVDYRITERWQSYTVRLDQYKKVSHFRTLIFCRDPEVLIVFDRLKSGQEVNAIQRWHFGDGLNFEARDRKTFRTGNRLVEVRQHHPFDTLEYFASDDAGNSSCVAGEKMYETRKCPLIMTQRKGRSPTFLTTIAVSPDGSLPSYVSGKSDETGVSRRLVVAGKNHSIELKFLDNDDLQID